MVVFVCGCGSDYVLVFYAINVTTLVEQVYFWFLIV